MKTRLLLALFTASLFLSSCNDYGRKVKITDKSEVYYKGDGATEADAKKLGDYLLRIGYFDEKTEKTVQLVGDKNTPDTYTIKFVVDKDALKKDKNAITMTFWYWQDMIANAVFNEKKIKIILADTKLKDIEAMDKLARIKVGNEHYAYLKGNSVAETEGKNVADSLEKAKFFDYTAGAVLLTKENGKLTIRFMPNEAKQTDKAYDYNTVLENYRYIISKYALGGDDVKLVLIDQEFTDVKTINEPTDDRKALIDRLMHGQPAPESYSQTQYSESGN